MIKASVIGVTGYAGEELVRTLCGHPEVELTCLTSETYVGKPISDVYFNLKGWVDITCQRLDVDMVARASDVVFASLPHGIAMGIATPVLQNGKILIDLGADFRLKDPAVYGEWYGKPHAAADLLNESTYGLSEVFRSGVKKTKLVANPGCYPTGALLGLAPLKSIIKTEYGAIIDSKSGVSGAGRSLNLTTHFVEVNENTKAYNVAGRHRHIPEIEQVAAELMGSPFRVCFTPHLVPMTRGILSTIYVHLNGNYTTGDILEIYNDYYEGEPFVKILNEGDIPQTKSVFGSNNCHIGLDVDKRTGLLVVVTAIDNLGKGAAGQAVQNMNIVFGLDETSGLRGPGVVP